MMKDLPYSSMKITSIENDLKMTCTFKSFFDLAGE